MDCPTLHGQIVASINNLQQYYIVSKFAFTVWPVTVGTSQAHSGPCILRPPVQPDKYAPKLKVVLKWRYIYSERQRAQSARKRA